MADLKPCPFCGDNYGTAKERRAKKIRGVKHTEEHNKRISESMKRHFAKMDGDGNG